MPCTPVSSGTFLVKGICTLLYSFKLHHSTSRFPSSSVHLHVRAQTRKNFSGQLEKLRDGNVTASWINHCAITFQFFHFIFRKALLNPPYSSSSVSDIKKLCIQSTCPERRAFRNDVCVCYSDFSSSPIEAVTSNDP